MQAVEKICRANALREEVLKRARSIIGCATYLFSAVPEMAPDVVNCYTFTRWAWLRAGVDLPLYPFEQRAFGLAVAIDSLVAGDLIFASARQGSRYPHHIHVGIASGKGTVIHAVPKRGVIEVSIVQFFRKRQPQGACRVDVRCIQEERG